MKTRALVLSGLAVVFLASAMEAAGPLSFFSVAPCRVVDTRWANGPQGGPALSSGVPRNFQVAGYCGVPSDALGLALNVTVVAPTQQGFLKFWEYLQAQPGVSNINFNAGEPALANGALVPMRQGVGLNISVIYGTAAPGTTHVIIDVAGYYKL
jgi:hypothetical protein